MAERARLNERETKAIFELGEMVDGNPRQFERLIYRDNLSDVQMGVLKKLAEDRRPEGNDRDREDRRLTRKQLNNLVYRAHLTEREADTLFQLAETADWNARRLEQLLESGDLTDLQSRVARKLARDED